MNKEIEEALEGSIEKWRGISRKELVDAGPSNCPLCNIFRLNDCYGCPVIKETEKLYCMGTPYEEWNDHQSEVHAQEVRIVYCPTCQELAERELEFLKSLRPAEQSCDSEPVAEAFRANWVDVQRVIDTIHTAADMGCNINREPIQQPDFSKARIGDRVWSSRKGWGTIKHIYNDSVVVKFDSIYVSSYYFDGKLTQADAFPELFWSNVPIPKSAITPPKRMRKEIRWFFVWIEAGMEEFRLSDLYKTDLDCEACMKYFSITQGPFVVEIEVEEEE